MSYDTNFQCWQNKHANRFPTFTKPQIVGYYSIDGERRYHNDADNLKYLKLPKNIENVNFNLNHGYENVIRKPTNSVDEGINHLLEYIRDNIKKLISKGNRTDRYLDTDFISFRGLLRLIMCSPYEHRDDWCITATKYKGNIYFLERETEARKKQNERVTDEVKKICSYGFKFEQYVLVDDPNNEPDISPPVKEAEEFACLFKTRIEQHDLFYSAETDGILSNEKCDLSTVDPNTLEFVEVKVRRKETNYNQGQNFLRFNLRKWWCQSFLVGIPKIYMGLRNDGGFVKEIKILDTSNLPKMAKKYWSAAACTQFLNEFLNMIEEIMKDVNCPYTVYEFYWNPKSTKTIRYNVHEGNNDFRILPDWYIESIRSNVQ